MLFHIFLSLLWLYTCIYGFSLMDDANSLLSAGLWMFFSRPLRYASNGEGSRHVFSKHATVGLNHRREAWHPDLFQAAEEKLDLKEIGEHAFKTTYQQHKIVHLNDRPTQLYYQDTPLPDLANQNTLKSTNGSQKCRMRVSVMDIYITYDDSNREYVDVFFYCNGWCCGVDCCHLNGTFMFVVALLSLAMCAIVLHLSLRTLCQKLYMQHALRKFRMVRKRRVITRANCQRRRRGPDEEVQTTFSGDVHNKSKPPIRKEMRKNLIPPRIVITSHNVFV